MLNSEAIFHNISNYLNALLEWYFGKWKFSHFSKYRRNSLRLNGAQSISWRLVQRLMNAQIRILLHIKTLCLSKNLKTKFHFILLMDLWLSNEISSKLGDEVQ